MRFDYRAKYHAHWRQVHRTVLNEKEKALPILIFPTPDTLSDMPPTVAPDQTDAQPKPSAKKKKSRPNKGEQAKRRKPTSSEEAAGAHSPDSTLKNGPSDTKHILIVNNALLDEGGDELVSSDAHDLNIFGGPFARKNKKSNKPPKIAPSVSQQALEAIMNDMMNDKMYSGHDVAAEVQQEVTVATTPSKPVPSATTDSVIQKVYLTGDKADVKLGHGASVAYNVESCTICIPLKLENHIVHNFPQPSTVLTIQVPVEVINAQLPILFTRE